MSYMATYTNLRILTQYHLHNSQNPDFYPQFAEIARRLLGEGRTVISSKRIFEDLRDDPKLKTAGGGFKAPNALTPVYARRFMDDYPQYGECFVVKTIH